MSEHILSKSAATDLSEIWDNSVSVWGVMQADRYLRDLSEAFDRNVEQPDAGRDRSMFLAGMRSVTVGRHVVFYRRFDTDVVILRVVHERRNLAALVFSEGLDG